MKSTLSYRTLQEISYDGFVQRQAPVRVLQFGEGNFLRAFADAFFDLANEHAGWNGKIAVVQPIARGLCDEINAQDGLYTLYLRGFSENRPVEKRRLISVIDRCYNPYLPEDYDRILDIARSKELRYIVSNTTEAGIVYDALSSLADRPPSSFPAKLTALLHARFLSHAGGITILSCELIDRNGDELQRCCLRHADEAGLGEDFRAYLQQDCLFCSTLVDRIVPGRIREEDALQKMHELHGYTDNLIDVGELFGVWYIEGPSSLNDALPFRAASLPVSVVPDINPYKKRKVRILNGAHTAFSLGAWLAGFDIVRDCMNNADIRSFVQTFLEEEVIPCIDEECPDCHTFAKDVTDRFLNPFIDHQLLSISLNSTAKWKARVLPTLLDYTERFQTLPRCAVFSLAAYIAFYSSRITKRTPEGLLCSREDDTAYTVSDDEAVLDFYEAHQEDSAAALVHEVLAEESFWDRDLTRLPGLEAAVLAALQSVRAHGAMQAFREVLQ